MIYLLLYLPHQCFVLGGVAVCVYSISEREGYYIFNMENHGGFLGSETLNTFLYIKYQQGSREGTVGGGGKGRDGRGRRRWGRCG
jgi:hypothetical protein